MKIFFLDDDATRITKVKRRLIGNLHRLYIAETVEESRRLLLESTHRFDLISLDHDLGGKIYTPSDERSGFAVAQFVARLKDDQRPNHVNTHTYYDTGATNILKALAKISEGRPVTITDYGFDTPEFWQLFEQRLDLIV